MSTTMDMTSTMDAVLDISNTTSINPESNGAFRDSAIGGGLIALGFLGLVSILSTVSLITFIVYRIFFWRSHYKSSIATNQYILLILSLLCADLIQALSFVCSFYWYGHEPIGSSRHWCTAQGVMIHLGDVASAFFVLAIALHTWYQVGLGRKLDDHTFMAIILLIWGFSIILTIIPPAMHTGNVYVASGAWCWIDKKYEGLRLGTHYAFIFFIEFAGLIIYGLLFLKLNRSRNTISRMSPAYDSMNDKRITHAARLMAIYPIVFMVLTAPLAISRMALYGDADVPEAVWVMAGCLMTSSGWVDSLLYVFTRRALLSQDLRRPSVGGEGSWSERKPSRTQSELESLKSRSATNLVPPYINSRHNSFFPDRSVENLAKLGLTAPPPVRPVLFIRPDHTRSFTSSSTLSTNKKLPKTPNEPKTPLTAMTNLDDFYDDSSPILSSAVSPYSPRSKPHELTPRFIPGTIGSLRTIMRAKSEAKERSSFSPSTTIKSTASQSTLLTTLFRKSEHMRSRANSPVVSELPGDMNIVVEKDFQVQSRPRSDAGALLPDEANDKGYQASVPWASL